MNSCLNEHALPPDRDGNGRASLRTRLKKHFGACNKVAAVAAGMAASGIAAAAVVPWIGANIVIPVTTAGVYINVETQVSNPSPGAVPGWDLNPWATGSLSWFNPTTPAGGVYLQLATGAAGPNNLPLGTVIPGTGIWTSGASTAAGIGAWTLSSSQNYIGFRFDGADSQTRYGYARVQLGASQTDPIRQILDIWYESTPNTPITIPLPPTYCTAGADGLGGFPLDERIINVSFAGINNPSADVPPVAPAYQDWTAVSGNVTTGLSYPITIDVNSDGNPGAAYSENKVRVWIDLNIDSDFDDLGELVFDGPIGTGDYSSNITIPGGATIGSTRMRIRLYDTHDGTGYANVINDTPCGLGSFSEVEDYTINIAANSACVGQPNPGATTGPSSVCPGASFNLGLTNFTPGSGVSYLWQRSTIGAGGPFASFGAPDAATISVSQSVDTWYQCVVSCTGNPDGTSGVLAVSTLSGGFPLTFESLPFPGNCWSKDVGTQNTTYLDPFAPGAYGASATSARFYFYLAAAGGSDLTLTSPAFAPTSGMRVTFDGAGAQYLADLSAIDAIYLETSSNGPAGPWTTLQILTNAGVLNTAPATNAAFVPTAAQWVSLAYAVPDGTTAIRFRGVPAFGNTMWIDNINLEVIPTCIAPTLAGLTATLVNSTTADINWVVEPTAVSYDVEVRQGGNPGDPGAVFTTNTALTTVQVNSGLVLGQTYQVYVRSQCGPNGTSTWTGPRNYLHDYCAAGGDNTVPANNARILSVVGAGLNAGAPPGTQIPYANLTANVGSMAAGGTYGLNITREQGYTFDQILIWVDWNDDVDFNDPGELVHTSPIGIGTGPLASFNHSVTCPPGTPAGNYRMRIRRHYADPPTWPTNYTPCGNAAFGQVLDFTINVCSPMLATTTVVDNCPGSFSINVNVTDLGSGPSPTIIYSLNGGGAVNIPVGATGLYTLDNGGPGFGVADNVAISLDNGTACVVNFGKHYSNCEQFISCPTDVPVTHEYRANDPRTWTFTVSPAFEQAEVNFTNGCIDPNDAILFYDAPGGNQIGQITGVNTLVGQPAIQSPTNQIHIVIVSNATDNFADGFCNQAWNFEVGCVPGCTPPAASVAAPVLNCATGTYTVNVTVNSTESNGPVGLTYTLGGVPQDTVQVGPGGSQVLPPTGPGAPLGTPMIIKLLHENDPICDVNNVGGGAINPANTCPPANDECAGATPLTVYGAGGCPGGSTTGNFNFATLSTNLPAPTCTGPFVRDLWFQFNTGTAVAPLFVTITGGTATGLSLQYYTGTCGALVAAGCVAGSTVFNGIPQNTTIYVRVSSSNALGGTVQLCVSASSCAGVPFGGTSTVSSIGSGSALYQFGGTPAAGPTPAGNYIVEYGPSATFTTPGTGASPGPNGTVISSSVAASGGLSPFVGLSCLLPATQYRVVVRRDCGGGSYSLNHPFGAGTLFTTTAAPAAPTAITPATCAQAAAIPDAGCASGNALNRSITVTSSGTQLGVDATFESIDLVISHISRGQLNVRLVSPAGCEYPLILARGGTGDNFGNPASCPGSVFKLKDGFPAVSTSGTANNVVGTFAPEQPLSAITGNPNGNWLIRICDATAATTGTLDYVKLNIVTCAPPVGTITRVNDCANGYSLSGNFSSLGSATSVSVVGSVSGTLATVNATGAWGPTAVIPWGTSQTITYVHNLDTDCNVIVGTYPGDPVPCFPNDVCFSSGGMFCPSSNCGTGGVSGTLPISGQPNSMGSNVIVESVDLILTGTFRGDNQIRLTSPNGVTVLLINQRGGAGDNFGDISLCPNGNFKLKDGVPNSITTITGTPLTLTGVFAPEQPLANFHDLSNPNGNWTVTVCDNAGGDEQTLRYFKINFAVPPCFPPIASAPVASPDPGCVGTFSVAFNVTGTGSSAGGVVNITNTGGAPVQNGVGVGPVVVGPFTYGAPVSITLVHLNDPACNVVLGPFNPVNPCVANGACVPNVSPGLAAIPDNNPAGVQVAIPISGLPTTLGNSPGNAFLESVDMKLAHTWRGDLRIWLTSPGGQTDTLISRRLRTGAWTGVNENGDNLGDPNAAVCTDGVFKFKDGAPLMQPGAPGDYTGAAWTNGQLSPAVTVRPEGPLAIHTGNPNGNWTLTMTDLAGGDLGWLTHIKLNFQTVDCDGVPGGSAGPGSPCTVGPLSGTYDDNCNCVTCTTDLEFDFTMDSGSSMDWEIREDGTNNLVQSGSTILGPNELELPTCLPDGCFHLIVTDAQGDGITGGGYVLRLDGTLQPYNRIIDNRNNYAGVNPSQVSGPPVTSNAFCIPLGSDRLVFTSCDKMDWKTNPCGYEYIVANANPLVTAQYGVTNTTSGYEMWWFNPNGGYSFRRVQYHNTTNGLSASSTRACHFKLNSWTGNQLQQNVLYNVKVRGIVAGAPQPWGPACRMMIDQAASQCPRTKLHDIPGESVFSCGATRGIASNQLVHARPVRRMNASCAWVNANRYQFRFRVNGQPAQTVVKTSSTNQYFVNTTGLVACRTYEVDVRASFDNGATWCVPGGTGYADPDWGDRCFLYTTGTGCFQGGNQNMVEESAAASMRMFPNPNRGDQLFLSMEAIEAGVSTVSVDIFDAFGKRAITRTIPVTDDGFINTVLELNGSLATGLYMVNITAGETVYTERLVIQP